MSPMCPILDRVGIAIRVYKKPVHSKFNFDLLRYSIFVIPSIMSESNFIMKWLLIYNFFIYVPVSPVFNSKMLQYKTNIAIKLDPLRCPIRAFVSNL